MLVPYKICSLFYHKFSLNFAFNIDDVQDLWPRGVGSIPFRLWKHNWIWIIRVISPLLIHVVKNINEKIRKHKWIVATVLLNENTNQEITCVYNSEVIYEKVKLWNHSLQKYLLIFLSICRNLFWQVSKVIYLDPVVLCPTSYIRPNKNICVLTVFLPTLIFILYPNHFWLSAVKITLLLS